MPEIITTLVPVHSVRVFLPQALPWIEKTLAEFRWIRWTLETIVQGLLSGELILWATKRDHRYLFVITDVIMEVGGPTVRVLLGGGELDEDMFMLEELAQIESWAKNNGATSIIVEGRMGFKKLLAPQGYQFEAATFRRTLTNRMH